MTERYLDSLIIRNGPDGRPNTYIPMDLTESSIVNIILPLVEEAYCRGCSITAFSLNVVDKEGGSTRVNASDLWITLEDYNRIYGEDK